MKLEELKNRINILQYNQEKELGILDNNKKSKLDKFIKDFNNKENTSLIEQKIKKLQEESEKLQLLMKKDLDEKIKKKEEEINNKEKEEEEKRIDMLKKMKEQDREYVEKRKKENNEKLLKLKEFIRKKPPETNYLYQKENSNYINKENNLVKMENIKRKAIMKHIDLKEFDEMRKNFEIIKTKKMKESNEKMKLMKNSWSQRFKLIPLYVNPIGKLASEEENKMKQEEQNKILQKKKLKKLQQKYNVPKPQKIIIEKIIEKEVGGDKLIKKSKPNLIKSNSYSDVLRQKMIEKYKIIQNRREKNKKDELLADEDYYLDEPQLSQKILAKNKNKEKININEKNKINKSFDKNKNKKKKEPYDYLKERRKINEQKKEKKRNAGELTSLDNSQVNDIKKLIKDNNGINDNILKVAKCKLESIEEKKKQKNLLLKCSGGVANKPELGEEVCDLMIDSIQAKLSLIKEIDKSLDESINDEEKKDEHHNRYSIQENTEENNNDEEEDN